MYPYTQAYKNTIIHAYIPEYLHTDIPVYLIHTYMHLGSIHNKMQERKQERAASTIFFQPPHSRGCRLHCKRRHNLHGLARLRFVAGSMELCLSVGLRYSVLACSVRGLKDSWSALEGSKDKEIITILMRFRVGLRSRHGG